MLTVGRTGSGKSTLALSLLRCIFTEGEVYFDGVDIFSIDLTTLRSKVSVIPQAVSINTHARRKSDTRYC